MFEDTIIPMLRADQDLSAILTQFGGQSAVFAVSGPEEVKIGDRYIVVRISASQPIPGDPIVSGDMHVDYYDYGSSRVNAATVARRVEDMLDQIIIDSAELSDIRLSIIAAGDIPATDPRAIHHNTHFGFRATRKQWIINNF